MDNKLLNSLKNLGLSDNESAVYIAAMKLGPSNPTKIASTANIKRTTVYAVIDSLKAKGLMRIEVKGWKKIYVAENPEKLEKMFELQKKQFSDVLPEFFSLYNLKESGSFIKYYEGLAAMKTVYEDILKDLNRNDDYMAISDTEKFQNIDRPYFDTFLERRTKLHVKTRLLLQDSPLARKRKKFDKNFNEHIKILPKDTELVTNLVVIPNRVIIHQLTPPILAMVIENKSVIQMCRQVFEIIWKTTED